MDVFKRKEVELGEDVFFVQQYPPFVGLKVLAEVQKVLLPALAGAANGLKGHADDDINDTAVIISSIGEALATLPEHLDGEKMEQLAKLLLDSEYVSVKRANDDRPVRLSEQVMADMFTGRYFDMIVLMVRVFQVNYLDFTRLSSVPIGVRNALGEIGKAFQAKLANG